ncbi:MAG: rRNA maturation RNAse YbeY, partial [Phycisphaerae bacterium]|nr:rRNA maturation RNAse YbeY [Phycisphaerae bacterium]
MRVPRKKLQRLIRFVAAQEKVRVDHVDLVVVTARRIASLNRKYRGRGGPTDVLSFDLSEVGATGICAQIVVCGEI